MVAEGGGGGAINADRWSPGAWETFVIEPLSEGAAHIATANGGVIRTGSDSGLFGNDERGFDTRRFVIEHLSGIQPR